MKESFKSHNIEPKTKTSSELRLNLDQKARRLLLATVVALSSLVPNKSEAQKTKETLPPDYTYMPLPDGVSKKHLYRPDRKPINVTNKNHPRLKSFNDSLETYYNAEKRIVDLEKINKVTYRGSTTVQDAGVEATYKNDKIKPLGVISYTFPTESEEGKVRHYTPYYREPKQPVIYKPEVKKEKTYDDYLNELKKVIAKDPLSGGEVANKMIKKFKGQPLMIYTDKKSGNKYEIPKPPDLSPQFKNEIKVVTP